MRYLFVSLMASGCFASCCALAETAKAQFLRVTSAGEVEPQKPDWLELSWNFASQSWRGEHSIISESGFTHTKPISDLFDLKTEGIVDYASSSLYSEVLSFTLGTGASYHLTDSAVVTASIHYGLGRSSDFGAIYGTGSADVSGEIYYEIGNGITLSAESTVGYVDSRTVQADIYDGHYSEAYIYALCWIGGDISVREVEMFSVKAPAHIKLSLGMENKIGAEQAVENIYSVKLALFTVDHVTGNSKAKAELQFNRGDDDFSSLRFGLSYAY